MYVTRKMIRFFFLFLQIFCLVSGLVSGLANTPASPETQNGRVLLNYPRIGAPQYAEALSESKIQNPKSKIQNPKSKIQNPKSKIHAKWSGLT
jgi:hypothetical protein